MKKPKQQTIYAHRWVNKTSVKRGPQGSVPFFRIRIFRRVEGLGFKVKLGFRFRIFRRVSGLGFRVKLRFKASLCWYPFVVTFKVAQCLNGLSGRLQRLANDEGFWPESLRRRVGFRVQRSGSTASGDGFHCMGDATTGSTMQNRTSQNLKLHGFKDNFAQSAFSQSLVLATPCHERSWL